MTLGTNLVPNSVQTEFGWHMIGATSPLNIHAAFGPSESRSHTASATYA